LVNGTVAGIDKAKLWSMNRATHREPGETVPRLRFPEFRETGEWKNKKIGDLLIEELRPIELKDEDEYSLVIVKRRYEGVISRGKLRGKAIKVKSQFLLQKDDFLISKRQIVHCACGLCF
jgi:type I restriction enzyme S subunit